MSSVFAPPLHRESSEPDRCPHLAGKRPPDKAAAYLFLNLDFRLFRNLQGVIHLDPKVADRALELGVP